MTNPPSLARPVCRVARYNGAMTYRAYIFDLDGTLLDTLPDLVRLTNMVLRENGWPERTTEEVLSFVGNGGRNLLELSAPAGTPGPQLDEAFARWRALYPTYGHALTRPFTGIPETLARLKDAGAQLGVLSNKFDAAVKEVIERHFPGVFDIARGECPEIPRKPDPRGLQHMMVQLDVVPEQVAYVGDSGTDMSVAVAAGAFPIGVAWGYRPVEELRSAGAQRIATAPAELVC